MQDKDWVRFWSKVDKSSSELGCWLWTAGQYKTGYGAFHLGKTMTYAHRISSGIPGVVDHKYSSRGCPRHCINPEHLRPASRKQNAENTVTRPGTSSYRGVSWSKVSNKWAAYVTNGGKKIHLGLHTSEISAAVAALKKRLELFTHNDQDRILAKEWGIVV